ncbi:hypothetical protein M0804_005116 [Polistes exclamans]|nr:hypothetical protein M0804_005116 [Polistes exclamans]
MVIVTYRCGKLSTILSYWFPFKKLAKIMPTTQTLSGLPDMVEEEEEEEEVKVQEEKEEEELVVAPYLIFYTFGCHFESREPCPTDYLTNF